MVVPAKLPAVSATLPGPTSDTPEARYAAAREELARFQQRLAANPWDLLGELRHTLAPHLDAGVADELHEHGARLAAVEPSVARADDRHELPRLEAWDGIGRRADVIRHPGAHDDVGDVIYGSGVVARLVRRGGLREGMAFHFLNCTLGEAGHNCPVICGFEAARLLQGLPGVPQAAGWIDGLLRPSYRDNLTASQFLTEVTGGSDVGANATRAHRDADGTWRIRGEKWFTSNADADLNVITARISDAPGTRGLSVFCVPRRLDDGALNTYALRRLKEKLGTRALATAEIDFENAWAVPLAADVERGFRVMMTNVVHHSRIALAVSCVAMAARAHAVAEAYAQERSVFGRRVIEHPLAAEHLAGIRCHVVALQAGLWNLIALQDALDTGARDDDAARGFLRLMANGYKQVASRWCVHHCHHAIDTLGGNGTIETFSPLPRLLRDSVIEENWEGTHNTVRAQVLRDVLRHDLDAAYLTEMEAQGADLGELRAVLGRLRRLDAGDRELLMAPLLERMVHLHAWTALATEARRPGAPATKTAAAALFARRHLTAPVAGPDAAERAAIEALTPSPRAESLRGRCATGG